MAQMTAQTGSGNIMAENREGVATVKRGMIIDINLNPAQGSETGKVRPCIVVTNDVYNARVPVIQVVPITSWSQKKSLIQTNITILPSERNGLEKKSIADCLQTRPIDVRLRAVSFRGNVEPDCLKEMDRALKVVFSLV